MKLELNDQTLMHAALIAQLHDVANLCETLDATEHALGQLGLSRQWWNVTRGGSHVAVNYIGHGNGGSVRVAMFSEGEGRKPTPWTFIDSKGRTKLRDPAVLASQIDELKALVEKLDTILRGAGPLYASSDTAKQVAQALK